MSKAADYQSRLRNLDWWEEFLICESGLPGPRANLELLEAVYREGERDFFLRSLAAPADAKDSNDPHVFLLLCGLVGLGKLVAAGDREHLAALRSVAADPRWRVREAVAIALQHWGDADVPALLDELEGWAAGNAFEQRAAVAAACEPRLLKNPLAAERVLVMLDRITAGVPETLDRKNEGFIALRKTLGYGWSVAAAASPDRGLPLIEKWLASPDADVRWIMRENLKKNRLKGLLSNRRLG